MPNKHVMVVEDDANTLSGYLEFLSAAGFDPMGVSDGAEALRIAIEHPRTWWSPTSHCPG